MRRFPFFFLSVSNGIATDLKSVCRLGVCLLVRLLVRLFAENKKRELARRQFPFFQLRSRLFGNLDEPPYVHRFVFAQDEHVVQAGCPIAYIDAFLNGGNVSEDFAVNRTTAVVVNAQG